MGTNTLDGGGELPGVQELFEGLESKSKTDAKDDERMQRAGMRRNVDAGYHGFSRDEMGCYWRMRKRKAKSPENVIIREDEMRSGRMPIPDG